MLLVVRAKRIWHLVTLVGLGVLVLTVSLVYIDGAFGMTFWLLLGLALLGIAKYLPSEIQTMTLTVMGLTSCLYAVWDIKSDVIDRPGIRSDAGHARRLDGCADNFVGRIMDRHRACSLLVAAQAYV